MSFLETFKQTCKCQTTFFFTQYLQRKNGQTTVLDYSYVIFPYYLNKVRRKSKLISCGAWLVLKQKKSRHPHREEIRHRCR